MIVLRWLRNTFVVLLVAVAILVGVSIYLVFHVASANDLSEAFPTPTGPYTVGVHDFEFTDTVYPVDREQDAAGRRLMVRVWYPAAAAIGEQRPYFEPGEYQAVGRPMLESLPMLFPETLFDPFRELLTHSYVGAPISDEQDAFPTIVYSLGALSYVHQSTALMEELASHGYLVFGVTHPGGASGVLYPNGNSVRYDDDYQAAILALFAPDEGLHSTDVGVRYEARAARWVDDNGMGPWLPRWRDDNIAVVDFIEAQASEGLLGTILAKANLNRLAYAGISYGGSAAASSAQADERARAILNIDGTHFSSDLLDRDLRVPLLLFSSEPIEYHAYSNEFFFEALMSMGDRSDITRVWIPRGYPLRAF